MLKGMTTENHRNNHASLSSRPPSLIKWSGSKRSTAFDIFKLAPSRFNRYFEPFLGGGALLFYFAGYREAFASDIYSPLIDFWNHVKASPDKLHEHYEENWVKLQQSFPEHYYEVRKNFNQEPNGLDLAFLSRTCVNGIIRFNSNGEFNNSLHLSRRGMKPELFKKVVNEWSHKLYNTTFTARSFENILTEIKENDFVYLDPPYLGSRNRYIESLRRENLIDFLKELNYRKAKWALSFDGSRGDTDYCQELIPKELYCKRVLLNAGLSAVSKVLNAKVEDVVESLYLNYHT